MAAKLDKAIESELLSRLRFVFKSSYSFLEVFIKRLFEKVPSFRQGTYGDIYNFRQEAFEHMLDENETAVEREEEMELEDDEVVLDIPFF